MSSNNIINNLSNIFSDAPLAPLDNTTQMNTLYYPSDLITTHPNYITFFLNENIAAKQYTLRTTSNASTTFETPTKNINNKNSDSKIGKQINSNTQRTGYAIALYTPNDITEGMSFDWKQTELGLVGGFTNAGDISKSISSAFNNYKGFGGLISNIGGALKTSLNNNSSDLATFAAVQGAIAGINASGSLLGLQDTTNQLGFIAGGYAVNPFMEILFSGAKFREFKFNFIFSPKSVEETQNIKYIIKLFKYNSSPALSKSMENSFFVYPGTFDIKYYNNGIENSYINRISTCALTNISVSYTANQGNQFVTFKDSDSGISGAPVMIGMSLSFVELEMLNKDQIRNGF